jgi:hypothetical protein
LTWYWKRLNSVNRINTQIRIGDVAVGAGCAPFVVAEVGINHNGELARALEMIHVAKDAGCDAVKFQTFKATEFVSDPAQMFRVLRANALSSPGSVCGLPGPEPCEKEVRRVVQSRPRREIFCGGRASGLLERTLHG